MAQRLKEAYDRDRIISCRIWGKQLTIPSLKKGVCRYWIMCATPFFAFLLFGLIFASENSVAMKIVLLCLLCLVLYSIVRFIYDDRMYNITPINIYLSTKFWLYVTFITYFFQRMQTFNIYRVINSLSFLSLASNKFDWFCGHIDFALLQLLSDLYVRSGSGSQRSRPEISS